MFVSALLIIALVTPITSSHEAVVAGAIAEGVMRTTRSTLEGAALLQHLAHVAHDHPLVAKLHRLIDAEKQLFGNLTEVYATHVCLQRCETALAAVQVQMDALVSSPVSHEALLTALSASHRLASTYVRFVCQPTRAADTALRWLSEAFQRLHAHYFLVNMSNVEQFVELALDQASDAMDQVIARDEDLMTHVDIASATQRYIVQNLLEALQAVVVTRSGLKDRRVAEFLEVGQHDTMIQFYHQALSRDAVKRHAEVRLQESVTKALVSGSSLASELEVELRRVEAQLRATSRRYRLPLGAIELEARLARDCSRLVEDMVERVGMLLPLHVDRIDARLRTVFSQITLENERAVEQAVVRAFNETVQRIEGSKYWLRGTLEHAVSRSVHSSMDHQRVSSAAVRALACARTLRHYDQLGCDADERLLIAASVFLVIVLAFHWWLRTK